MKNLLLLFGVFTVALLSQHSLHAQNIFSGERVQVVGTFNGFSTVPYGTDYRTTTFRRLSVASGNPVDGRGQWVTTFNVQSSGGDIAPINMTGGGVGGFLFISGPQSPGNPFQNKWAFSAVGQGAVNSINDITAFNSGNDMGLNMSTAGRYTFVFNDCGYTQTNAKYYVGYTANAPVTVTNGGTTFLNSQPVVSITTSATPSAGENVYVRYRATTNDFTTGTSVVQATGGGTLWSATLPQQTCGNIVYYYVYTSTRSLAQINGDAESNRSLAALRYDDNAGANYSFTVSPVPTAGITNNSGTTVLTCSQTSISVTATGGDSYSWDNGLGNGDSKSITLPGTYTVTATAANGCTDQESITVTQNLSNNTFTGTGNWTDNARWSCGAPPASSDNVTIAAGANAILNTNFTVAGTLTMTATSTLTVNPTQTLTISGTADFAGQSVTFKSDLTGTASLGQVNGTLNGATNVTVERYIPNNGFRSWRLLSVPTSGSQTIKQSWQENQAPGVNGLPNYGTQITGPVFANGLDAASASASLKKYNGTAWEGVTSTTGAISAEKAYFMYVRGERSKGVTGLATDASATTLRTTGTIYTGTQTTASIPANSFGVVGNMYPSAIDFTGLTLNGSVATVPYFYIWDAKKLSGSSLGAYQLFTSADGYTCNLGGGSYVLSSTGNTIIESGQAFFVKTGGTPGSVTFNESAKTTSTGNLGFRPSSPSSISKLVSRLYTGTNMADVNVVVFDNHYSNGLGDEDASKLSNTGENFAISKSGTILAFEGRQAIASNDIIEFNMDNVTQQDYRFEFVPQNLATPGLTATLEDKYLHSSTPVSLDAATTVNFTVDANAASAAADRFRIVFKQATPLPVSFISISANRTGAGVKADWKVSAERNIRNYQVERSADGRNFSTAGTVTATGNSSTDLNYSFTDAAAPATALFYRIKSNGTAGDVKYSAVVKVAAGKATAGYSIAPNPVENGVVNLAFSNQPAGRYTVRIMNTSGQSLAVRSINHTGGNSNQLLELPATMASGTYQVEITAPDKTRTVQSLLVN